MVVYNWNRLDVINSSPKRRRFCFYFLLLHHPSRFGSVLQNFHSWASGRSYPKRCPFGGISATFARIPVNLQSGYAFIRYARVEFGGFPDQFLPD